MYRTQLRVIVLSATYEGQSKHPVVVVAIADYY